VHVHHITPFTRRSATLRRATRRAAALRIASHRIATGGTGEIQFRHFHPTFKVTADPPNFEVTAESTKLRGKKSPLQWQARSFRRGLGGQRWLVGGLDGITPAASIPLKAMIPRRGNPASLRRRANNGTAFRMPDMYRKMLRACGLFAASSAIVATSPCAR
jgi:hypothetical protein